MQDWCSLILDQLEKRLADIPLDQCESLIPDPWIANSLLQKAIRRGDGATAAKAARGFLAVRSSAIWRRLMIIAFEDVGIGAIETVIQTVAACVDPKWRHRNGGNVRVVSGLAHVLAETPKDRSADYLICATKDHPALEEARRHAGSRSIAGRLAIVEDTRYSLSVRATTAWYVSGLEWRGERRVGTGDIERLLTTLQELGVPEALSQATLIAARRTREPLTVMVPLIWLAAASDTDRQIVSRPVPAASIVRGVPLYALDKHTRLGKRALERFARENEGVRDCLARSLGRRSPSEAIYAAAFHADAAAVALRLNWRESTFLEWLGIENDLLYAGVMQDGIVPLIATVRDNLDHLDALRADVLLSAKEPTRLGEA